jgi:hypothetical protein
MSDPKSQAALLRKLTDPKYAGPGAWFSIHINGAHVKNYNDLVKGIEAIELILENWKCEVCNKHIKIKMETYPPRKCLDCKHKNHEGGLEMCLHIWAVDFHNEVNIRLGKPVMDYRICYPFYSNAENEICNDECGEHSNHDEVAIKNKVVAKPEVKVEEIKQAKRIFFSKGGNGSKY